MDRQHEAKCRRCAQCCRLKVWNQKSRKIVVDIYCPALDVETKTCMIYSHRQDLAAYMPNIQCDEIEEGMRRRTTFPSDCAYAKPGYSGMDYDPLLAMFLSQDFLDTLALSVARVREHIRRDNVKLPK